MGAVDIYSRWDIMGERDTDTWLRHGFMKKARMEVCECFKREGRSDVARLLDDGYILDRTGTYLFNKIPPRNRSVAAGIRAGGGSHELRMEIDAWVDGVKKVLYVYAVQAHTQAQYAQHNGNSNARLACDYMGPFHDNHYVPLWRVVEGALYKTH
jgi:hypothetical protein